jgi:hypothetical protein
MIITYYSIPSFARPSLFHNKQSCSCKNTVVCITEVSGVSFFFFFYFDRPTLDLKKKNLEKQLIKKKWPNNNTRYCRCRINISERYNFIIQINYSLQQMTQHDVNFVAEFLRDNFNHFTLVGMILSVYHPV